MFLIHYDIFFWEALEHTAYLWSIGYTLLLLWMPSNFEIICRQFGRYRVSGFCYLLLRSVYICSINLTKFCLLWDKHSFCILLFQQSTNTFRRIYLQIFSLTISVSLLFVVYPPTIHTHMHTLAFLQFCQLRSPFSDTLR